MRPAKVVVGEVLSEELAPADMAFQGIVWGSQFWNAFWSDADKPVRKKGFTEIVYADDLNGYKEFFSKHN